MGSKKSKSTSTRITDAPFVRESGESAISIARNFAETPFQAYNKPRVADLSSDEVAGQDLIRNSVGNWQTQYDQGASAFTQTLDRISGPNQADIQARMDPYIENVLNSRTRRAQENFAVTNQEQRMRAARTGSFGGSRNAVMEALLKRDQANSLDDINAEGYSKAFESAMNQLDRDKTLGLQAAQQGAQLGAARQSMSSQDAFNLQRVGEVERRVSQGKLDADYQEFMREQQDPLLKSSALADVVAKAPLATYSTTENSTQKQSGGGLGQAVGLAAALASAYFTGGGSLALFAGSQAANAAGGGGKRPEVIATKDGGMIRGYADGGAVSNEDLSKYFFPERNISNEVLLGTRNQFPDVFQKKMAAEEIVAAMREMGDSGALTFPTKDTSNPITLTESDLTKPVPPVKTPPPMTPNQADAAMRETGFSRALEQMPPEADDGPFADTVKELLSVSKKMGEERPQSNLGDYLDKAKDFIPDEETEKENYWTRLSKNPLFNLGIKMLQADDDIGTALGQGLDAAVQTVGRNNKEAETKKESARDRMLKRFELAAKLQEMDNARFGKEAYRDQTRVQALSAAADVQNSATRNKLDAANAERANKAAESLMQDRLADNARLEAEAKRDAAEAAAKPAIEREKARIDAIIRSATSLISAGMPQDQAMLEATTLVNNTFRTPATGTGAKPGGGSFLEQAEKLNGINAQ